MINDCYWFVKEVGQDSYMAACCVECGHQHNIGWFWEGSIKGYGDYDLSCDFCKKIIYKQNEEDDNDNGSTEDTKTTC